MTAMEAVMWRSEVDPRLRSDGLVMDLLESTPDWDRLVAGHEWATRLAPRLRQRVVEDALNIGPPAWISTELDMAYHLSRVRLAEGQGMDDVLELAAIMHMAPFDTARPLWQAMLVEGLPDGGSVYLLKVHHSITDGTGVIQLFDLLHSDRAEPTPDKKAPEAPALDPTGPTGLAVRRGLGLARGSVGGAARAALGLGGRALRTVTHPQDAVAYAASLARVTKNQAEPSPLLRKRGLSRRLRVLEVPMADLRAAGRAVGGSLNDAYLAGLLGGLREYHHRHGVEVDELPIALPVSLRKGPDDVGGNRFAGAFIKGPVGEKDPAARMALLRERVLAARDEPALDFLSSTAPVMSRLPSGVLAGLTLKFSSGIDLQASNIPGIRRTAYLAGARIRRMFIFGPVPGSAIMATLVSHEDVCCITLATDTDAVPDPDVLVDCMRAGMDEVVALGGAS